MRSHHDANNRTLGQAINAARHRACLTAERLASRASARLPDYNPITRSALARWETGSRPIPEDKLRAIEATLNVKFAGALLITTNFTHGFSLHHSEVYYDTAAGPVTIARS